MRTSAPVAADTAAASDALVLAFDPGHNVGAAWVRRDGTALRLAILALPDLDQMIVPPDAVVLVGDGTGSGAVVQRLRARGVAPTLVDERETTLVARGLYFRDHPPHGLLRLLPPGMRTPPRQIDDYAA